MFEKLRSRKALLLVVCAIAFVAGVGVRSTVNGVGKDIRVIYSLDGRENDKEIIKLIDDAQERVYFAIYYFTKKEIADALVKAKKRGVDVKGIMDREASKGANKAVLKRLEGAMIPVVTQKHLDGIMHIKAIVTESAYASGSYNWTDKATESNDEILEIGYDENIRKRYEEIISRVISDNEGETVSRPIEIDYTEAPKHIGEQVVVSGEVFGVTVSKSGTAFLDFCERKGACLFSAVVFRSAMDKFPLVKSLRGHVRLSGVIKAYRGVAEMVLEQSNQILR